MEITDQIGEERHETNAGACEAQNSPKARAGSQVLEEPSRKQQQASETLPGKMKQSELLSGVYSELRRITVVHNF